MEMGKYERHELSWYGAVRRFRRKHPIHDTDENIGNCFDATNRVYETALFAMWPDLQQWGYNTNTLGNIAEGLMAIGMYSRTPAARSLGRIIERISGSLYVVCCEYNCYSLADVDRAYTAMVKEDKQRLAAILGRAVPQVLIARNANPDDVESLALESVARANLRA